MHILVLSREPKFCKPALRQADLLNQAFVKLLIEGSDLMMELCQKYISLAVKIAIDIALYDEKQVYSEKRTENKIYKN